MTEDADPAVVLAALLEASEDAVIGVRHDGVISSWNPGAERLLDYSAAEIVGQPSSVLLQEVGDETDQPGGGSIQESRQGKSYDAVLVAKGGRRVNVRVTVSTIRDRFGETIGRTLVARDLGDRRVLDQALRTTQARWRALIDSAVDAIIVIDAKGTIEVFNASAQRMFGYSEQEAAGRNVNMLMPSPYRDEHDGYLEHYLRTGEHRIIGIGREVTGLRRDGSTFPVHLSVGEMRVGAHRRFTGILHDLSARAQLEERLRDESALARLGEMAAVIAHEVRNPLAAVRGAIQVVGRRLPSDGKDAAVIKEILTRLDALNGLLNDLLLFGRTPEPRFAPVSLAGLLTSTGDLLSKDPALRRLHIKIAGDASPIIADAELLRIVFQNLLINAVQAMHAEGTIQVGVAADSHAQVITVSDSGPGIPTEVRERLFKPFFTTKARGTGLGLSIAKRLVEVHGGTIGIECPPGGGTRVTVQLPIRAGDSAIRE